MEAGLDTILNGGALAIFAWYAWNTSRSWQENNREWRNYLTERNGKLEKALDKLGAILEDHKLKNNE